MRWRCFGYEWWQVAALVFIVLFGIPYLVSFVRDLVSDGEPEFSAEENELRGKLDLSLHSLPLVVSDDEMFETFYDCSKWAGPIDTGVNYYLNRRGDELRSVEVVDHDEYDRIANTSLCDRTSRGKVTSVVWLGPKEVLVTDLRIYEQLGDRRQEDLEKLVQADVDKYFPDQSSKDYQWLPARQLGDAAYGFRYTVVDAGEPFDVYEIFFDREVVYTGMSLTFPAGELSGQEALSLAETFDAKIGSQIDLLTAKAEAK